MLEIQLTQNRLHVRRGQKATLFTQLDITTDPSAAPLGQRSHHVALAIDCSSSMDGQKIQAAKNTALQLVDSLSASDLVSIVTFASDTTVALQPTAVSKQNISDVINSIKVGGATALHAGISTAFEMLEQQSAPGTISRLMLISDGKPNMGLCREDDFAQLTKNIRSRGITMDVFGIGDYAAPLLMMMAEIGRGKWHHIADIDTLTSMINVQVTEMQKTMIANPQLSINLMPDAELATIAITKPTLQEIDPKLWHVSDGATRIGLKDIIKDVTQTVVMRVSIPPTEGYGIPFMTATITEGSSIIASKTASISCTDDKNIYNLEADPNPRVMLAGSEATLLLRKGLEGDEEATRMANTIINSLEDPETTRLLNSDTRATVISAKSASENTQHEMSDAEKKQALHNTTVINTKDRMQESDE